MDRQEHFSPFLLPTVQSLDRRKHFIGEENKIGYPKNIERKGRNVKWNLRQEDRDGVEKGGRGKVLRIGTRDTLRDIRPKTGE